MNPFLDDLQIEELDSFQDWDDDQTKFEVEDYYNDSSFSELLNSKNDF